MDIKQAAERLGVSVRHVRRLIKAGQIPASKVRVKKVIEVEAWEIPDDVVQAANDALRAMSKYENFSEWMVDTAEKLSLTLQDLSKRTQLPMQTLVEIARKPGHLGAQEQEIEDKIGKVLMRADIEKRCTNGQ